MSDQNLYFISKETLRECQQPRKPTDVCVIEKSAYDELAHRMVTEQANLAVKLKTKILHNGQRYFIHAGGIDDMRQEDDRFDHWHETSLKGSGHGWSLQ